MRRPPRTPDEQQRRDRACKRAKLDSGAIGKLDWASGGRRFVVDTKSGIAIFDTASGRRTATLDASAGERSPDDRELAPHGKTLAGVAADGPVRLWDLAGGKILFEAR